MKRKTLVITFVLCILVGVLISPSPSPSIPPLGLVPTVHAKAYCDDIRTDCYEKYMVWWNSECVEEWGHAYRGWCLSEAGLQYRFCVGGYGCPLNAD